MVSELAAKYAKTRAIRRQLPITGSAHKATVVGDRREAARRILAARDVPPEYRRAAVLDCAHHLQLPEAHVAAIGVAPSGAMVAEDIRNFQGRTTHSRWPLRQRWFTKWCEQRRELVERTHDVADDIGRDVRIARGRV